ncbi:hypothetical protein [Amycolatopsis nigrescens]|uniref:hypothetical protein n=1 Tax=Amycolatopsis nigrescens TaxID=381445 RepID=UPI0003A62E3E|nr:hypothetical protein [Amycolatopsis nigrescens]
MARRAVRAAAAVVMTAGVLVPGTAAGDQVPGWQRVGDGITGGVSGVAAVQDAPVGPHRAEVIVVKDNKKDGQPRVSAIELRPDGPPEVRDLRWEDPAGRAPPRDLEALDAVPGQRDQYLALASEGTVYRIVVTGGTATVQGDPLSLPGKLPGDDYESFAVFQHTSGQLFAVWASRGKSELASLVRAAPLTLGVGTPIVTEEFAVPFPDEDEVRHISDLKVRQDGTVLVSSASDPNVDDGPFSSAVYDAGRLVVSSERRPVLELKTPGQLTALRQFDKQDNRKIEAILFLPDGQQLWGTDDENNGGSVRFDQVTR